MRRNLENSMRWMLAHEGGFVNHPKDPGGATNFGVTQRVYDSYRKRKGLSQRSVRAIEPDEVAEIYKAQYWDAVRADELPDGVDYAVFDYAVNSGPGRSARDLQRELGVNVDGIIGFQTLAAAQAADPFDLIERLCNRRMRFLRSLKHWPTFGRGWTARVMGVKDGAQADDIGVIDRAMVLARGAQANDLPNPVAVGSGKGQEAARESVTQSTTLQASAAQVGSGAAGVWAAVTQLDGNNQTIALVILGVIILAGVWVMKERIKKWAEGIH
jgi:lysozyme family protein